MSLSPTMLGRIGVTLLEQLAAQAAITANPSFHDDKGWDVMLQLPSSGDKVVGPLDRLPPGLSCMVQVKTTTTLDRSEPIKLSNWQRMCSDPIPWFVFVVHVDPATHVPMSAYLVQITEDWCAAVLRRLRELSADDETELHKRHLNVVWSDADQLSELHGRELARRIRAAVPDQFAHVADKIRWFSELGYEDRARRVTVSVPGNPDATFQQLADVAIGHERYFPKGWTATVSDVRFGIEGRLTSFDASAGEIEYHPSPQGKLELILASSSGRRAVVAGDAYRAGAVFPFLPPEFDRVRVVAENISAVLVPAMNGDEHGWLATFQLSIPREPITLQELRTLTDVGAMFLGHNNDPFTLTVNVGTAQARLTPGTPEAPDPDLGRIIRLLDAALMVCAAFDVPVTAPISVSLLEEQEKWVRFIGSMLETEEGGQLVAPYREVVPVGTQFGVIQEAALRLNDRTLGLLIGAYGKVSDCGEVPGKGAGVEVSDARLIRRKVVVLPDSDDAGVDEVRVALKQELLTAGCAHILEPEEYRRLMSRIDDGKGEDVADTNSAGTGSP